jgi:S1-C subfamily serine protease
MSSHPGISVSAARRARVVTVLLAAALVFLAAFTINAHGPSELQLNDLKRAVVVVTTFDHEGQPLLQGSGFFITPDQIATNLHVIAHAAVIQIKTFAGKTMTVQTVVATDAGSDLALLQVNGLADVVLDLEPAAPTEGEAIVLLSNPQGATWQVTRGEVRRVWQFASTGSRLQITAGVFPGSSGGPVLNQRGHVIGVAVMRMNSGDDLNFAVPAASLKALQDSTRATSAGRNEKKATAPQGSRVSVLVVSRSQ